MTLYILRGISGSGKSTYARLVINGISHRISVSRDSFRQAFYGSCNQDYYAADKVVLKEREDFITKAVESAIGLAIDEGKDVYYDATNIYRRDVNKIASIATSRGAEVEVINFEVDLAVAFARIDQRARMGGHRVPYDVLEKQYKAMKSVGVIESDSLPKPFIPEAYAGTPGKPKAFLVDIDGTLAHMNNKRGPFDWKSVGVDDVDEVVAEIANLISAGSESTARYENDVYHTIVMSGRDESCRSETAAWLNKHHIHFDHLFMRPENDSRKDNIIKEELFNKYVRDNYDVQFVIDDRWQVCRMWLQKGLKVLNVSGLDRGEF